MASNTDIYTKLQHDHKSVEHLLDQMSSTTTVDAQKRQNYLKELKHNFIKHNEAKRDVFYKMLRQHAEAQTLMQESEQDQKRIETLLDELDRMSVDDPQWRAKLQSLKVNVEQHIHQVEGPIFAKARTLLTDTQAQELGEQFDRAKGQTSVGTMTGAATGSAAQYAPETTERARDMGARAQHEAEHLGHEAKAKGRTLLHDQQQAIAEQVGGLAEALHQTAQHLREQNRDVVAQYTGQAAQGLERFSQTLRERDMNGIMGQVEDFARRQPAVFVGSAALLGFLASRFLKSSAESRHTYAERSTYGGNVPAPPSPVGPGAPVDPAMTSAGDPPSAPVMPAGYDRDNATLRGGN